MSQGTYKVAYAHISLFDRFLELPLSMQKRIKKGSFGIFNQQILPILIDMEPMFAPLYSQNPKTRPSEPTYLVLAYLILKDLNGWTDEELERQVLCNVEVQYALGTTSFERQLINHNTLNRFRAAVALYENKTGVNLIANFNEELAIELKKIHFSDSSRKRRRMDSVMIDSGAKKMNRMELIYTCVANAVSTLDDADVTIPENLAHYLNEFDRNFVTYHDHRSSDEKMIMLGKDAVQVRDLFDSSLKEENDYLLLERMISEQLVLDNNGQFVSIRNGKELNSKVLQNPSDPDATFREKAGKQHIGYVGNFAETVDEETNRKFIDSADLRENIYSDSQFCKDEIAKMAENEDTSDLVVDGGYSSEENILLAAENGIQLIPTDLTGKDTPDLYADFSIDEKADQVTCPNGLTPDRTSYDKKQETYRISYLKNRCENCPHRENCPLREYKRVRSGSVSQKKIDRARRQRTMETREYQKNNHFRNGVEAIPSQLRRKQKIDSIPVRGKCAKKIWFLLDIVAINVRRALRYGLEDQKTGENSESKSLMAALVVIFASIITIGDFLKKSIHRNVYGSLTAC